MSPNDPHCQELRTFNTEIYCLLKSQNPRARSLFPFIERTLRQFHLERMHTAAEIFNEAYTRGVAFIERGNAIHSPKAWMRTTAYNVIRELSRDRQRYQQRYESIECECVENLLVPEEIIELDIETVRLALQELGVGDRRIIELKTIENLCWKEIGQRLVELGEPPQTEAALRKRGQRAMQRLRQNYHKQRPPVLSGILIN